MPDKPSRSAFIPLLLVGMVALIVLTLLIPLSVCFDCGGTGLVIPDIVSSDIAREYPDCEVCGGSGKLPLLNIWSKE